MRNRPSRHRATIAREISEAAKIGDDVLTKIGTVEACIENGTGGSGGINHYYIAEPIAPSGLRDDRACRLG